MVAISVDRLKQSQDVRRDASVVCPAGDETCEPIAPPPKPTPAPTPPQGNPDAIDLDVSGTIAEEYSADNAVSYSITVLNQGSLTAHQVSLRLSSNPETQIIATIDDVLCTITPDPGEEDQRIKKINDCDLGDIDPDQELSIPIAITNPLVGDLSITHQVISLTDSSKEANERNNSVTLSTKIAPIPEPSGPTTLEVNASNWPSNISVNDNETLSLRIKNAGEYTAKNVRVDIYESPEGSISLSLPPSTCSVVPDTSPTKHYSCNIGDIRANANAEVFGELSNAISSRENGTVYFIVIATADNVDSTNDRTTDWPSTTIFPNYSDFNDDRKLSFADYYLLLPHMLETVTNENGIFDTNNDGMIDIVDMRLLTRQNMTRLPR